MLARLLAVAFATTALPALAQQGSPDLEQVADLAVRLTNEFRSHEGRRKVVVNTKLLAAARDFAQYMAKTGRFSHEADGSTPAVRARQHGYDYCIVSENIAYRYSSTGFATHELAQGFVDGWKNSPGHRMNMLEPDVTETAVAVVPGKAGHYYAAQLFGRPISQTITFSIANRSTAAVRYRIDGKTFSLAPRETRTHRNCRSSAVEFDWPGKQREARISPKHGDHYAVVRSDSGGFHLKTDRD